jgi:hypothetical protein
MRNMHRNEDMKLYLFSFPEFCTLDEQELRRFNYMKDIVLDEAVPTKFNLYFSYLYFIFYKFSNFMNGYKSSTVTRLLYRSYEAAGAN